MANNPLLNPTNGPTTGQGPATNPTTGIDVTDGTGRDISVTAGPSFFEKNKDLILYGGAGLVGIALIYYASKKSRKRRRK